MENSFVTVALDDSAAHQDAEASWNARLWKVKDPLDELDAIESDVFGLSQVVSLKGGSSTDRITSTARRGLRLGSLLASELSISKTAKRPAIDQPNENDAGLVLCSLTENGYVTTHVSTILYSAVDTGLLYLTNVSFSLFTSFRDLAERTILRHPHRRGGKLL